ncbi:Ferric/cupric reductase transmembrane component 1 [Cladorrhinum sp. PSN332]|nr:Ferric/cupric reductase transmembrane component 1 [Cladorrhinum sp. PSN332]
MKRTQSLLVIGLSCGLPCRASVGLPGITNPIDDPACAYACTGSLSGYALECSTVDHSRHSDHGHGPAIYTSPDCRSNDTPYLTTVAWCLRTKCAPYHVPTSRLEAVWEQETTGDASVPAKWSYTEALLNVADPPTRQLVMGDTINATLLAPEFWNVSFDTAVVMAYESRMESTLGLVLLVVGFSVPIVLTALGYLPFVNRIQDTVRPYITYPSIIKKHHVQPLPFLLGNAPTVGQALFITLMIVLNVLVSAVGYHSSPSHMWLQNQWQQTVGFLMYRTGVLSYAMLPLVILFAGRNNILLWLTNWSHSTYLLLHRWVARLFMLQALLHSVLAVILYKDMGIYSAQATLDYWAWGVAATVLGCIMLVGSVLYVRQRWYEIFLLAHIVMAVIIIVGCWYHVVLRFPPDGSGFTTWLYAAIAVWAFDRVARLARIVKHGVRHAKVTEIGGGYVRLDIPGVRWSASPGRHVYVHLPTVNMMRPWESHPFSVLSTSIFHPRQQQHRSLSLSTQSPSSVSPFGSENNRQESNDPNPDVEKGSATTTSPTPNPNTATQRPAPTTAGITLIIRRACDLTRALPSSSAALLTLLDGPYTNNKTQSILRCDRLLLIAGGIGITSILPWLDTGHPNIKIAWGVKDSARCLVTELAPVLGRVGEGNKEIRVGRRLDVEGLLREEQEMGWGRVGVVVSGPGGLCDDVRAEVARLGRANARRKGNGCAFVLEVDAYSW